MEALSNTGSLCSHCRKGTSQRRPFANRPYVFPSDLFCLWPSFALTTPATTETSTPVFTNDLILRISTATQRVLISKLSQSASSKGAQGKPQVGGQRRVGIIGWETPQPPRLPSYVLWATVASVLHRSSRVTI